MPGCILPPPKLPLLFRAIRDPRKANLRGPAPLNTTGFRVRIRIIGIRVSGQESRGSALTPNRDEDSFQNRDPSPTTSRVKPTNFTKNSLRENRLHPSAKTPRMSEQGVFSADCQGSFSSLFECQEPVDGCRANPAQGRNKTCLRASSTNPNSP